ncbi:MAG: MmgE/PrpD family protein [Chloroflexi bacterium]|nr:MmgE/PrpD family protein [Chloroflexota bacterium]
MDAAVAFAKLAAQQRYEDLPPAAVDLAKKDILDTLGTTLAGSAAEGAEELVGLIKEHGGKPESSVVGHWFKVPSPQAALVNGYMARSVDYDDTHDVASLHAGGTVVSAAFAVAEARGGISGKEFITAVALGVDMVCRMGMAKQEGRSAGWTGTPLYGYFGSTLASARVLGLTEEQTISALGIAYGQAAGTLLEIKERVLTKNLDIGAAARAGVFSALAAQRGITGARNCLEDEMGLFHVYHRGNYDPKHLTDELGKRFEIAHLSFKPYPCCRRNQPFVDLAIQFFRERKIRPEDVEEVIAHIDHEPHLEFHPVEEKQNPRTITDAQFSIPYCIAVALARGAVGLDDFTESAIKDQRIIALARKVVPKLDVSLFRPQELCPAVLEVRTRDGAYLERVEHAYGTPLNPMSMESLVEKFRDCALHAKKKASVDRIAEATDMVSNLENVRDVTEVMRLLS